MNRILSTIMDRSSAVELKVARIYDCMAVMFESDPTLAQFWTLFAEAERYHSLLIQMQKLGLHGQADPGQIESWRAEIEQLHGYLDGLLRRLTQEGWKPSVSEAFMMAHDVEVRSLDVQGRCFELMDQNEVGEICARLHEEDMAHRHKLLQARQRFDPAFAAH